MNDLIVLPKCEIRADFHYGAVRIDNPVILETWEYKPTLMDKIIEAVMRLLIFGVVGAVIVAAFVLAPQAAMNGLCIGLIVALVSLVRR